MYNQSLNNLQPSWLTRCRGLVLLHLVFYCSRKTFFSPLIPSSHQPYGAHILRLQSLQDMLCSRGLSSSADKQFSEKHFLDMTVWGVHLPVCGVSAPEMLRLWMEFLPHTPFSSGLWNTGNTLSCLHRYVRKESQPILVSPLQEDIQR